MFIAACYIVDHYCLWFDRGVVTACYIFISRNPDKKHNFWNIVSTGKYVFHIQVSEKKIKNR